MSEVTSVRPMRTAFANVPAGAVALIALVLLGATVVVARASNSAFVLLAIALFALLAMATARWPRSMLVVTALAPIADRFLIAPFMPVAVQTYTQFSSEALLGVVALVILALGIRAHRIGLALRHPATIALAAFVALGLLSALVNRVPLLPLGAGLFYTLDAVTLFYLVRIVGFDRRQTVTAVGALVAAVLVMAVIGIGQGVLRPDLFGLTVVEGRSGDFSRIGSLVRNPNSMGTLVAMVLPLTLFGMVRLRDARWRTGLAVVSLLLTMAMLLTYSRGSWLGLLVGGGATMLLFDRRVLLATLAVGLLAIAAVTFMPRDLIVPRAAGGAPAPPTQFDLIGTTGDRVGAVGAGRDLRTQFVLNALPILRDHPLLGVGPGRYGGGAAAHFATPVYAQYGTDKLLVAQITVDNFWLHVLIEGGILGAAALLATLAFIYAGLVRVIRRAAGDRVTYVLATGLFAGSVAVAITTGTTMGLEANTVAFMFWFMLGLGSLLSVPRVEAA